MFPHGGPGVGLLLLRIAAAAMFALNLTYHLDSLSRPLNIVVIISTILITLSLCAGFLTPILTVIACTVGVANLFLTAQPGNVISILRIFTFAALFFLGPGAYSIDARLFGLRVTVVPPRKEKNSQRYN
jgi:uncharacterized membrane protein YphA (DoxX/SURF4 family)